MAKILSLNTQMPTGAREVMKMLKQAACKIIGNGGAYVEIRDCLPYLKLSALNLKELDMVLANKIHM